MNPNPELRQNSLHNGRSAIVVVVLVFPYTTDALARRRAAAILSFFPSDPQLRATLPLLNCLPSLSLHRLFIILPSTVSS